MPISAVSGLRESQSRRALNTLLASGGFRPTSGASGSLGQSAQRSVGRGRGWDAADGALGALPGGR